MYKIILYFLLIIFTLNACGGTWDSVKRGLTGEKRNTTDEFLVKKKDPLILPPDYENLPTPDERRVAAEEFSIFEENLEISIENNPSTSNSVEDSILKKIRSK